MPRASWRGFLRLSLVTCPVYLSPATTGTKPIRLHQVWQPAPVEVNEDALRIGVQGSRVRHHRHRSSPPTIPTLRRPRAGPPHGSRFGRMIREPARRSTNARCPFGFTGLPHRIHRGLRGRRACAG